MNTNRSMLRRSLITVVGATFLVGTMGCNNAGQGFFSGAAAGSLVGMGLGSLSGNMGKGAAAGALIGGLGGAILGDQNARYSGRSYYGGGGGYSDGGYYYENSYSSSYSAPRHSSGYRGGYYRSHRSTWYCD
ncbi:MAG: glycine zipper domain-containing protein [Phycisphaerales bacterium]